jgi:hypothetical protein
MNETFREILTLLKILITIPITSSEAERFFSILKRIKKNVYEAQWEKKG